MKRCALAVLVLLVLFVPYKMQPTTAQSGAPVPLGTGVVGDAQVQPGNALAMAAQSDGVWRNYTNGNYVRAFAVEGDYVWASTDGGVVRWNRIDGSYIKYTTVDGLADNNVHTIAIDGAGYKWFGTYGGGVSEFDGSTWTTYIAAGEVVSNTINAIAIDGAGHKWFGTMGGVIEFDGSTWTTYTSADGLAHNWVQAIAIDGEGHKWFGTNGGVSEFDGSTWTTYTPADGLADNNVYTIAIDGSGHKWFGTLGGVSEFDGSTWTTYTTADGLVNNNVYAIAIDGSGHKRFGTSGGVSEFDGSTWTTYTTADGLVDGSVQAIAIDGAGHKWVGTWGGGVSEFDGSIWTTHTTADGLEHNSIYAIAIDGSDHKWFGTLIGVSEFDGSTWTTYTTADGLAGNRVNAIAIDGAGYKWYGAGHKRYDTHSGGVSKFDGSTWTTYTTADGLASNNVRAIAIDGVGHKWFGTFSGVSEYIPGDAYEPDDTCAQASVLETNGAVQAHNFYQPDDEDWAWFDVVTDTTYTILASEAETFADVELDLYDNCAASPIYTDTNPLGTDARIVFTSAFSGTVWVQARNYDGQLYGDQTGYNLSARADRSQGLAIIAAGRLRMADHLQTNINNAANQAYLTFLQRGYSRDDIYYLNVWPDQDVDGNGLQDDVDGVTSVDNLRNAIQTWAQIQGAGPSVPLYIYLVDHGLVDRFYADTVNEVVTAESLNLWLSNLEATTGADQITVIVEMCHSGSFIDQHEESGQGLAEIAGPNRVIVSSTSSWAYAFTLGTGILFSDPFWGGMREGRSVQGSFQAGQDAVRQAGHKSCPQPGELEYKISCQEPWLDDNGNGIPNETDDGLLAQGRGLVAPSGWQVPEIAWVHVGEVSEEGEATIAAEVWDDGTLAGVQAMIIPPGYEPEDPGDGSLPEWDVPTVTLAVSGTVAYTATYSGFQVPGNYRVVVYAWDEDGHTAVPQGVVVVRSSKAVFLPLVMRSN